MQPNKTIQECKNIKPKTKTETFEKGMSNEIRSSKQMTVA